MSVDVASTMKTVLSLPPADRLRIAEADWDSLPEKSTPATPAQQAELNRRLDALEAAPEDLLTRDEVVDHLRGKL